MYKSKKGVYQIFLFFLIFASILILGFITVVSYSIIKYANDIISPELSNFGMVGDTNMTKVGEYTFGTLTKVINGFKWVLILSYLFLLIFPIIIATRINVDKIFIFIYFVFAILLIFLSIIISNAYQDLYESNDNISNELKNQTSASYLILYSPILMTIIVFITGIILFAGKKEDYVYYGI